MMFDFGSIIFFNPWNIVYRVNYKRKVTLMKQPTQSDMTLQYVVLRRWQSRLLQLRIPTELNEVLIVAPMTKTVTVRGRSCLLTANVFSQIGLAVHRVYQLVCTDLIGC